MPYVYGRNGRKNIGISKTVSGGIFAPHVLTRRTNMCLKIELIMVDISFQEWF